MKNNKNEYSGNFKKYNTSNFIVSLIGIFIIPFFLGPIFFFATFLTLRLFINLFFILTSAPDAPLPQSPISLVGLETPQIEQRTSIHQIIFLPANQFEKKVSHLLEKNLFFDEDEGLGYLDRISFDLQVSLNPRNKIRHFFLYESYDNFVARVWRTLEKSTARDCGRKGLKRILLGEFFTKVDGHRLIPNWWWFGPFFRAFTDDDRKEKWTKLAFIFDVFELENKEFKFIAAATMRALFLRDHYSRRISERISISRNFHAIIEKRREKIGPRVTTIFIRKMEHLAKRRGLKKIELCLE